MGWQNDERIRCVLVLSTLALQYGRARIPGNTGRAKVIAARRPLETLVGANEADRRALDKAMADHAATISHIRRLLENMFPCFHAHETVAQLRARMDRVVQHMNSKELGAGGWLPSVACGRHRRCQELVRLNGERLPK